MVFLAILWLSFVAPFVNATKGSIGLFRRNEPFANNAPSPPLFSHYEAELTRIVEAPVLPGLHRWTRWEPGTYALAGYEAPVEQLILQPHVRTIPAIFNLLTKLPTGLDVILLVSSRQESDRLQPWLKYHRDHLLCQVRVVVAPSYAPYSAWPRDSYIVFASPRHELVFVRPSAAKSYIDHLRGDAYTPVAVARVAGGILYDSKIYFVGGNIRVGIRPHGRRDVFVSSFYYRANQELGISKSLIEKETSAIFGESIVVLPEVDPHLDTYVTMAPRGHAFVGDPRMAFDVLDGNRDDLTSAAHWAVRRFDYAAKLDLIAKQLRRLGYIVHRVPWLPQPAVSPQNVFVTYNNGTFLDAQTFLMPIYDLPTDSIAQSIFEKIGLRVIPVNMRSVSWGGGSLHCITHEGARRGFARRDPLSEDQTTLGVVPVEAVYSEIPSKEQAAYQHWERMTADPNPDVAALAQLSLRRWRRNIQGWFGVQLDLAKPKTSPANRVAKAPAARQHI